MLVAILALYYQHGAVTGMFTFDLPILARWVMPAPAQSLMFLAFAWPSPSRCRVSFHTWLPTPRRGAHAGA